MVLRLHSPQYRGPRGTFASCSGRRSSRRRDEKTRVEASGCRRRASAVRGRSAVGSRVVVRQACDGAIREWSFLHGASRDLRALSVGLHPRAVLAGDGRRAVTKRRRSRLLAAIALLACSCAGTSAPPPRSESAPPQSPADSASASQIPDAAPVQTSERFSALASATAHADLGTWAEAPESGGVRASCGHASARRTNRPFSRATASWAPTCRFTSPRKASIQVGSSAEARPDAHEIQTLLSSVRTFLDSAEPQDCELEFANGSVVFVMGVQGGEPFQREASFARTLEFLLARPLKEGAPGDYSSWGLHWTTSWWRPGWRAVTKNALRAHRCSQRCKPPRAAS